MESTTQGRRQLAATDSWLVPGGSEAGREDEQVSEARQNLDKARKAVAEQARNLERVQLNVEDIARNAEDEKKLSEFVSTNYGPGP